MSLFWASRGPKIMILRSFLWIFTQTFQERSMSDLINTITADDLIAMVFWCHSYKTFSFVADNKSEHLSLETLSSQILDFEGKARANPIGVHLRCFLLVLPANVRLDWKVIASYKHSSFFGLVCSDKGKEFYNIDHWSHCYKTIFIFVTNNVAPWHLAQWHAA